MKKTWYCVTTTIGDDLKAIMGITASVEAKVKPNSSCHEFPDKDVYNDWFGSFDEALDFIKEQMGG